MVEKDELLQRAGRELAVFRVLEDDFRPAVRLAGCVQAEEIGLGLLWVRVMVLVTGVSRKK